ncbi:MAG: CRISPR-associated endonuclease Cas2 [Clostridia bacterium]|nr:CRISPR-associated endonuclease Cas2 [Clostridia bacterium]MBR6744681.1 CRISPR-associated endonuclease Cas2 [Clostridia bacterium]
MILTYDAESERLSKIRKTCKKYLLPVQRSVFEGHLTEKRLRLLKEDIAKAINPEKDHVIIYVMSYGDQFQKLEIGKKARR